MSTVGASPFTSHQNPLTTEFFSCILGQSGQPQAFHAGVNGQAGLRQTKVGVRVQGVPGQH